MPLETIRSAEFNVDLSASSGPPIRIEVHYQNGGSAETLIINAKVFARKDLLRLLAILNPPEECAASLDRIGGYGTNNKE